MAGPVVVARPLVARIVAVVVAAAFVVLFTGAAVVLPVSGTGVYFRPADQVSIALIGLAMAAVFLLAARPRVRADAEGIEVRNFGSTRRLRWDQVRRVAFPDGALWARLELGADEYLAVLAIQAVDRERAVEAIRGVRALHAAARTP